MRFSSTRDGRAGSGFRSASGGTINNATKRALHVIVRRVLRTNRPRTRLEELMHQEAQRLADAVSPDDGRESVVSRIVDNLQRQLPARLLDAPAGRTDSVRFGGMATVAVANPGRE